MSRHLEEVATSGRGRDINTESEAVATSECKENKVATSSAKERRSRHQSEVATSVVKKGGLDIIQRSRHHEQKREVATSFNGRDASCTEKKVATTHLAVATSIAKT